jgi:hypothetical protein
VLSHHSATAIAEGDRPVRILGCERLESPTSNSKPTLRNGARCLRNSHVAFGVLGGRGLLSGRLADDEQGFDSQDFAMPM